MQDDETLPIEASPATFRRIIIAIAATLIAAGMMIVAATGFVWAHDAPTGWQYPISCCSGVDCREVSDEAIIEGPNGYTIAATGETIPMTSRKVRPSPDGIYHWCSVGGKPDSATICLFVPFGGS